MKTLLYNSVIAIFAMILIAVNPVHAVSTIVISNSSNGTQSTNEVDLFVEQNIEVVQTNVVEVENNVDQEADTGDNVVKDNFGSIDIETGSIESDTDIDSGAADNTADLGGSEYGCSSDLSVVAENTTNGTDSDNSINIDISTGPTQETERDFSGIVQTNVVDIDNKVAKDFNTGYNKAKDNHGDVKITSGDIQEETGFSNVAGSNEIAVGTGGGVTIAVVNEKNGRGSDNNINISLAQELAVTQENFIEIENYEDKTLNTGGNKCKDNYGDCVIKTGDIVSKTDITNKTGSNDVTYGTPLPTPTPDNPTDQVDDPTEPVDDPGEEENPIGGVVMPEDEVTEVVEEQEEQKTILEQVLETIVPSVLAADTTQEDGTVLGAMQLPETGMGELPYVSWNEVLFGATILALGILLRRRFAESRLITKK